jgi:hypothetical protein
MDEFSYLSKCDEEEILNSWWATGGLVATKNTKIYPAGTIFRVDASDGDGISKAPLHNALLYVQQTYRVNGQTQFPIDWEIMNSDDITKQNVALEGIQLPFFKILPAKYSMLFTPDNDFLPYQNKEVTYDNGGVNITDIELETILTPIGFPFVNFDDVEYYKDQICKYMIRPALQRYFSYRPIIERQEGVSTSQGAKFMVEFPKDAYACIPYYTVPGGSGMGGGASGSPFAFYNEQMMYGGMGGMGFGGRFGRGVHYVGKQVPGFVGLESRNARIDAMTANQAFLNFFRREKYDRIRDENGKYWATGFSTVGGNLNFIWLKATMNWNDVKWEDVENIARPIARIEVLRNFGMLRSLIKQDIPGQLDATVLMTQADKIEERVDKILNSIGTVGIYGIERGGG